MTPAKKPAEKSDHEKMLQRIGPGTAAQPPLFDAPDDGPALMSHVVDFSAIFPRWGAKRDASRADRQRAALDKQNRRRAAESEARKNDLRKFLKGLRRQCPSMLESEMVKEADISLGIPLRTLKRWVDDGSVIVPPRRK